ncbi:hypothetical protein VTJ83DRAFT_5786 [Remersonia thermophila]|uniref:Uncharacterized protein n=1 Tax=Remersonia thermophila TaxID=72144 RepID=A0ABR4D8S8_9PEZI
MAPALALRRAIRRPGGFQAPTKPPPPPPSMCLVCFWSRPSPAPRTPSLLRQGPQQHRQFSSAAPTADPTASSHPRQDLHRALSDLQTHAANYTNLPRLQLALRNLSEPAGRESIRVAVLNLAPPVNDKAQNVPEGAATTPSPLTTTTTAQRLLRLALADPLRSPAAPWESTLEEHDLQRHSLLVRVGGHEGTRRDAPAGIGLITEDRRQQQEHAAPEVQADAPLLRDTGLEMLVADARFLAEQGRSGPGPVEDAVLVPTVDVAATTAGHVAPIATPVHMALLVGDGVPGAARIVSLPAAGHERDVIAGAVNFDSTPGQRDLAGCPLVAVNVDAARQGLEQFRADVGNAIAYERLWSRSNVGVVGEWLRRGAAARDDGTTKPPVRHLIRSLLRNAAAALQEEAARDASAERRAAAAPPRRPPSWTGRWPSGPGARTRSCRSSSTSLFPRARGAGSAGGSCFGAPTTWAWRRPRRWPSGSCRRRRSISSTSPAASRRPVSPRLRTAARRSLRPWPRAQTRTSSNKARTPSPPPARPPGPSTSPSREPTSNPKPCPPSRPWPSASSSRRPACPG